MNHERNKLIVEAYLKHGHSGASLLTGIRANVIAGVINRAGVAFNPTGPRHLKTSALNPVNDTPRMITLAGGFYDPAKGGKYYHHDSPDLGDK
jgi:hypothetical protein